MTSIKTFLARHPVPTCFALTFAISWGAALAAIGGSGGMRGTTPGSDPRFAYALMAMLMHASFTASLLILNPVGISGVHLVICSFALAAAVWILVAAVVVVNRPRLSHQSVRRRAA